MNRRLAAPRLSRAMPDGRRALFRAASCLCLGAALVLASHASADSPDDGLLAQVEARLAAVESDATLDATSRDKAMARLAEAQRTLQQAAADRVMTGQLAAEREAAPALIAETQAAEAPAPPAAPEGLSAAELDLRVVEADASASSARARLGNLRSALAEQRELRLQLPVQLAEARDQQAALRNELAPLKAAAGEAPSATGDALLEAQARDLALAARVALLEERRNGLELREQLLASAITAAEREVAGRDAALAALRSSLEQQRRTEAATLGGSVPTELIALHPELAALAAANRELLADQSDPRGTRFLVDQSRESVARLEETLTATEADFKELRSRLDILGRSIAAGSLVNDVLGETAGLRAGLRRLEASAERLNAAQLQLVALGRERNLLERDLAGELQRRLERMESRDAAEREALRGALESLLLARLSLLRSAIRDLEDYVGLLTAQQARQQRLSTLVENYERYLRARQLWLPNVRPVGVVDLRGALLGLASVASPALWQGAGSAFSGWIASHAGSFAWRLAWLAAAVAAIGWLLRHRGSAGAAAGTGPWKLAGAFAVALGLGVAWAIAARALGDLLAGPAAAPTGVAGLGDALATLSVHVFVAVALRELFRPGGPITALGRMRPALVAAIHASAGWYLSALPLLAMTQLMFTGYLTGVLALGDLGARLCLLVVMSFSAVMVVRLAQAWPVATGATASRWRRIAYGMALLLPLTLFGLVLRGYLQAAYWLFSMLVESGAAVAAFVAIRALLPSVAPDAEPTRDAEAAQLQARRGQVLRVMLVVALAALLLWIWRDALVAVRYLQDVVLWTTDGAQGPQAVTLANLLYFAVTLAVTGLVIWSLPVLFGTRSMDTSDRGVGSRYAMASLTKYAIGIAGVLAAFSLLNVGWSKLQWMAAGLSVGLGFGLQETVSNFVAGLILLSERPIRVGDRVSVGEATGIVTRIQIRATTIRDYDGRELIIPNKTLVTSEVSNWTLSNTDRRLQLAVGVDYGSDTALVEKLLLQAAAGVPWVLSSPAPRVVFELFGDNALQFRLYVWIEGSDYALDSTHALHMAVDRLFREHGIGISFPQRDVHLDTARPLEVRVVTP